MTQPKGTPIEEPPTEQWFAIVDKATGEAVSFGTVLGELAPELEAIPIADQPSKRAGTRWDAATKTVVEEPSPPPDTSAEVGSLAIAYNALRTAAADTTFTAAERTRLGNAADLVAARIKGLA